MMLQEKSCLYQVETLTDGGCWLGGGSRAAGCCRAETPQEDSPPVNGLCVTSNIIVEKTKGINVVHSRAGAPHVHCLSEHSETNTLIRTQTLIILIDDPPVSASIDGVLCAEERITAVKHADEKQTDLLSLIIQSFLI